jgi:hypothetical protein
MLTGERPALVESRALRLREVKILAVDDAGILERNSAAQERQALQLLA